MPGTSGILETDRWDEVLVKNILGNFRTTGKKRIPREKDRESDLFEGWNGSAT